MTPLNNLATKGVIGADREDLLKKYRESNILEEEEKKEKRKTILTLHGKMPVSPNVMNEFRQNALSLRPDWIESISKKKTLEWQCDTLKLMCGSSVESQSLRNCVIIMFKGTGRGVTRYSFLHHILKRNAGSRKELKPEDRDCLYQVI